MINPPFKYGKKTCIFCGEAANSAEHVWPKWAHDIMVKRSGHTQLALEGPVTKKIQAETYRRYRQGSIAKVAMKRVCRACNSGWMSDYENRLKPTLRAMIIGPHLALGTDTLNHITEYFCFKIMVLDWTNSNPIFSAHERERFYLERAIPKNIQLMIANCPDPSIDTYYRAQFMELCPAESLADHQPGKNIKSFAFGFGGIFVFALVTLGKVDIELNQPSGWIQLYPKRPNNIYWPPFLSISRDMALKVAESLDDLKQHAKVKLADTLEQAIEKSNSNRR